MKLNTDAWQIGSNGYSLSVPPIAMKSLVTNLLWLALAFTLRAGTTTVTSFTEIANARFVNVGTGIYPPPAISIDSLRITPLPPEAGALFGDFVGFQAGTTNDPGDGSGAAFAFQNYTINFSSPLAAFGSTFYHLQTGADNGMAFPALLSVYDGPNGSGHLIGSVTSSGYLEPGAGNADFVGVWSDSINIRSAVMVGTSQYRGFQVDGYGLSFTPIPEPSTIALTAIAATAWSLFAARRKRQSSSRFPVGSGKSLRE
jgi:hypothetical protein